MRGVPSLLAAIDARLGDGPRQWTDLTVVRNVGPLATRAPLAGDCISNRGCNALLARGGTSTGYTHFVKLRPAFDAGFERECAVTVHLARQPSVAALMPPSTTFVADGVRILLQRYCAGVSLERLILDAPGRWASYTARALKTAQPLLEQIAASAASVPAGPLRDALRRSTADLVHAGLSAEAAARIDARLAALPERACGQHGDFWPRNILLGGDVAGQSSRTWVIDFENCGVIDLPLYDVFHLIRSAAEIAGGWHGDWLQRWATAAAADELAEMVNAAAQRWLPDRSPQAVEAALLACLVDVAARLYRRGVALERLAGRLAELEGICQDLDRGALRRVLRSLD